MKKPQSFEPAPRNQIEWLAFNGLADSEIASILGCDVTKLEDVRMSLDRGRALAHLKLRRAQIRVALKGSAAMLIHLGRVMLGQSDDPQPDAGAPKTVIVTVVRPVKEPAVVM